MRMAFISYEYPPETGFGGIGTYTKQMAQLLTRYGYQIEVFSCTRGASQMNISEQDGILIHRVSAQNRVEFRNNVADYFSQRQAEAGFDLIESPEYFAEGLVIREAFPKIPMVVKLHTPAFLISRYNNHYLKVSFKKRIKQMIGRTDYRKERDTEFVFTSMADAVCSPSVALAQVIKKAWGLSKVEIIPNVFYPTESLLALEPAKGVQRPVVSYIGRLDTRKGIVSLIKAIPLILQEQPETVFRFIGGDGEAPDRSGSMRRYMEQQLPGCLNKLEFAGHFPGSAFAECLRDSSIVVLPSLWENYPYACLEAMSAGRAVVASKNGGMSEMLGGGVQEGYLIDPNNPPSLAKAILQLIRNPALCIQLGVENRRRVLEFSTETEARALRFYHKLLYPPPVNYA